MTGAKWPRLRPSPTPWFTCARNHGNHLASISPSITIVLCQGPQESKQEFCRWGLHQLPHWLNLKGIPTGWQIPCLRCRYIVNLLLYGPNQCPCSTLLALVSVTFKVRLGLRESFYPTLTFLYSTNNPSDPCYCRTHRKKSIHWYVDCRIGSGLI